ncbi:MAG: 4Fe-4S binding protein [Nitrospirae bacterium]|nr:4Fe-4S binding protein [Nitrospirota bacterium]
MHARRHFKPWRRAFYLLQASVMIGLPFLRVGGESALRFDIPALRLLFFGRALFIEDFFLFLLAMLLFVMIFVFLTILLGRVWCGWFCPQSAIIELQTMFRGALRRFRLPDNIANIAFHASAIALSMLISATLIWYFLPPAEMLEMLVSGSPLVRGFWIVQAALVYLMATLWGRRFCRYVCPYARMQGALFDNSTLRIEFDENRRDECLNCGLCAKVCPTGIDIRDGLQTGCVACAECVDACRDMTGKRGIAPLVRYSFGARLFIRPQSIISAIAIAAFAALFGALAFSGPDFDMTVSRTPGPLFALTADGSVINHYRVSVRNKTGVEREFRLSIAGNNRLALAGNNTLTVGPNGFNAVHAAVVCASPCKAAASGQVVFVLNGGGEAISREAAFFGQ